ncbi:MAG: hypothetical protein QY304_03070 [Candidatus Paceibacterota bacterium]|nr:MAG: hypothetical protein QY304_03070 [Candidatus Paceibacterota bacterium]
MMIKQKHLFITILVLGLFTLSLLAVADTTNSTQSLISNSETEKDVVEGKSKTTSSSDPILPIITDTQKPATTYTHPELGYSFEYLSDWLLGTYKSNGYEAVGLWDPVAQQQEGAEGHLIQGAKIEISTCNCAPISSFKNTIVERTGKGPETITSVSESTLNIYKDQTPVSVVRVDYKTELGGGKSVYFVGRDGLLYVLTLGIPNLETLGTGQLQEYRSVFEDVIQSFTFSEIAYENH